MNKKQCVHCTPMGGWGFNMSPPHETCGRETGNICFLGQVVLNVTVYLTSFNYSDFTHFCSKLNFNIQKLIN